MKKNIIIVLVLSLWFMSAYWLGSYYLRAQVVGVAVQKYVDVLDAESTDPQCTLEHCPNSSKSLPGMSPDRAPLTTHERTNMERHGPYAHLQPVTTMNIFRVTARDDGTVEALTQTTVTKCYSPADTDPYGSALNFYAITLAPSTIRGEYVVVDDVYYDVLKHPLPADARPVYVGGPKNPPPCA